MKRDTLPRLLTKPHHQTCFMCTAEVLKRLLVPVAQPWHKSWYRVLRGGKRTAFSPAVGLQGISVPWGSFPFSAPPSGQQLWPLPPCRQNSPLAARDLDTQPCSRCSMAAMGLQGFQHLCPFCIHPLIIQYLLPLSSISISKINIDSPVW